MTGQASGDEQDAARVKPVIALFRSPLFNRSETFVQTHATSLDRYQPLLVGLHDFGNIPSTLQSRVLLPASPLQRLRITLLGQSAALAPRARRDRPVLMHAHFGTDGLLALPLARSLSIPLVTTLHGYDVHRSRAAMLTSGRMSWMRYALFRRRLMAGGDLFVAVSEALRRRALALGYPAERTITHYNGVDLRRFPPGTAAREPGLVLHVGRLVEKKGTALLVRAFVDVRRQCPQARLVIIGDGPLEAALRQQIADAGLQGTTTFTGVLGPDAVAVWMRKAWLLAVPSVTASDGDAEGLPTVVVEAAASALPVVGSDHAGIPEAVVDGDTGFVVREGDAAALASRIVELLGTPRLQAAMAIAARRLAEERFDARRLTCALENHYDRLTGLGC